MNIGITVSVDPKNKSSIWINGINQNAIFLYLTLRNLPQHKTILVNLYDSHLDNSKNLDWKDDEFETKYIEEVEDDLDLIVVLGCALKDEQYKKYRNEGKKIVYYNCGNEYVMSMENILFKSNENNKIKKYPYFDEIWMIPQLILQNQYYLQTLNRTNVVEIPFVWNPYFLDRVNKPMNGGCNYQNQGEAKRISIFEPNLNVLKYCMYPLLIIENVYRELPELIKHIYVTNSFGIKDKQEFVSIVKHFEVIKKCTFENRYGIANFLSVFTDVVVSHQWENPLNYAYLDVVYLGYPLVHNAYLCKDLGYYYEGWNGPEGEKQLKFALQEHDKNLEEYQHRNEKVLNRFRTDNEQNVEAYDKLIKKLFN